MRRLPAFAAIAAVAAIAVLALATFAPAALAAEPMTHSGRVLVSTEGDVTIPAGEQADVVVVIRGTATIEGDVNTLVVVEGTAKIVGAQLESIVAVRSQLELGAGTIVAGEVRRLDTTVHQTGNADVRGGITDLTGDLLQVGAVLAPALFLIWLGFALATVVAALALAGLATRQVRRAEQLIASEPLVTGLTGFVSVILLPIAALALIATIIGAPLGAALFLVLPPIAFASYLVAAIWIGEWLLGRVNAGVVRERPYLAAVLGVVVLGALSILPILTILVALASLLGFGAIVRLAIEALRGTPRRAAASAPQAAATPA
jgi:hypothetical protein